MEIKISHIKHPQAEKYIISQLWQQNSHFADVNMKPLNIILYDETYRQHSTAPGVN